MGTTFDAKMGIASIWITSFVCLICVSLSLWVHGNLLEDNLLLKVALSLLPCFVVFYLFLTRVKSYELSEEFLTIDRGILKVRVSIEDIAQVEKPYVEATKLKRRFGNGGCFSFTGSFSHKKLGKFQAYFTKLENAVLLRFKDEKKTPIMISPENEAKFLDEISRLLDSRSSDGFAKSQATTD
ncbi:MAG: PH domain-containing protein [Bdellovibrionales bacterium]